MAFASLSSLKSKLEVVKSLLEPHVATLKGYAEEHPVAAAGIAGVAAVAACYGLSFVVHYARNPRPNIRMISISKKGKDKGKRPLLVLIHGWPDFADTWGNMVAALYREYDLLLLELPNYNNYEAPQTYLFGDDLERSESKPYRPNALPKDSVIKYHISHTDDGIILSGKDVARVPAHALNSNSWGWTFPAVVDACVGGVSNFVDKFRDGDDRVSLIIHDMGSGVGLSMYDTFRLEVNGHTVDTQRFKISRIASIDIGDGPDIPSKAEGLVYLGYQLWNVAAYLAPLASVGDALGRVAFGRWLDNAPVVERGHTEYYSARMNYMYFFIWLERWFGRSYALLGIRNTVRQGTVPLVPFFFGYGEGGPFQFHGKSTWGKEIPRRNAVEGYQGSFIYKGYPNCAHWVMTEDPTDWRQLNADLLEWLKHTDGKDIVFEEEA